MRAVTLLSLVTTALLAWCLLPLAIPPFGPYPASQAIEVLLWQVMAALGWPMAIFGAMASAVWGSRPADISAVLLVLPYPTMVVLTAYVLMSRRVRRWPLVLLHILLVFSFAAVWYAVRNGYNFMVG